MSGAAARELLVETAALGVRLEPLDGGRLRVTPASKVPPELRQRLAVAKPALLDALAGEAPAPTCADVTAEPDATLDLARGRKLLRRLQWTGRRVLIGADGRVEIVPRLGTADRFGQDVVEHVADIAAALAAEGRS